MKKLFWIRNGLLLAVLIFAVLGGNFLYTGAESASPLEQAADAYPLAEDTLLTQTFSPIHAKVTCISLALKPPGQSAALSESSGELTVILSRHATGEELYKSTVSLGGAPDHWYLDFPVDCRLEPGTQYDFSVLLSNCQDPKTPSLYTVPPSAQISEITTGLSDGSSAPAAAAAMRLTYDVLVPARLAVFLTALIFLLFCTIAAALHSRKVKSGRKQDGQDKTDRKHAGKTRAEKSITETAGAGKAKSEKSKKDPDRPERIRQEKTRNEITLNKILSLRIRRIPLIHILFFGAVTAAAVIVRLAFLSVKSNDFYIAYEVWINEIRGNGGLASLGKDIGDNPPLYMTLVTLASCLPFEPAVIVKLPSLLFDFFLAAVCVRLSRRLEVNELHRKLTLYAVILLNPLTLLDSAAWGQCDSLYSTFVLLTLLAICSAKPWSTKPPIGKRHAFWKSGDGICLLFAVAFSFKLQAVFFLPILCLLWIMQKRNVLRPLHLLWVPIVYTLSCIPMYLAGRSLKVMFKIYLGQANRNYGTLTLNYPNLYHLIGTWSESLYDGYFIYGLVLTFLLLVLLFYQLYCRKVELNSLTLCKVTALSILTICFCLPLVHERYAFVAEMLLFVIMIKDARYIKTALVTMLCTLFTYCSYLMQLEQSFTVLPEPVTALLRLGVIFFIAKDIFNPFKESVAG